MNKQLLKTSGADVLHSRRKPLSPLYVRGLILSIGGRSGIIWILIFIIPVVFTSMIHDSYENFLPEEDFWLHLIIF